ncbi:collagenase-like [Nymphalis io]|uniref:collagenase-like n=1 Tax=Inachis io TaxID=171585 RepID=UPI002167EEB0|nr:collagenase-like [Nymphalis io]
MLKYVFGLLVLGLVQANPVHEDEPVGFMEDIKRGTNRVSGGVPAKEGQFPHQVNIRIVTLDGLVTSCGGSVIHNDWIITATHCLANIANRVQRDDIALLKLRMTISYGPTIQPIRIQSTEQKDYNYENKVVVVSGFGFDDDSWNGGQLSDNLLWTYLRGLSNEECRTFFTSVFPSTVCARYYNHTDQSACHGDSGGPLTIVDRDGKPTMIGLVQFASWRGCTSYWPTAYVRPGYYQDWLFKNTGINFDWTYSDLEDKSDTLNIIN